MEEEEIFEILPKGPTKNMSAEEIKMALVELLNAGIKIYMGYDIEALLKVSVLKGEEDGYNKYDS
ncbi:MAG: hypothetical protein CEO40_193 [Parcubacteria group bacterium LiPW_72]|nr:MAG: hypothetical protein CEO40_193 [Parcubacteria group bacterium LiPW_72]